MVKQKNYAEIILMVAVSILLFIFTAKCSLVSNLDAKQFSAMFFLLAFTYLIIMRKKASFNRPVPIAVASYVIFLGISTLYANAGKFAINEYIKVIVGFSIYIFIYYASKKKDTLRLILGTITTYTVISCLMAIEGATLAVIAPAIEELFSGAEIPDFSVWSGGRLHGPFGNPNVFVSALGVSLFLSLYLYLTEENKKYKYIQGVYLVIMATTVLLAFSLGGTFSLALSVIGFLLFTKDKERIRGIVCIFFVLLTAFIGLFLMIPMLNNGSAIALLLLAVLCAAFILAEKYFGEKLTEILYTNAKKVWLFFVALIILAIAVLIAVFTLKSSLSLGSGISYYRVLYPEHGENRVEIMATQNTSDLQIRVFTKDMPQIMTGSETLVYDGDLVAGENSFELIIPENAKETFVLLSTEGQAEIESAVFYGASETVPITLNYTLLPENIENRLQGLPTNSSFLIRSEYIKDGFTLFMQSPIIGHGLGGFENAIQSVQKYGYETKYAHNHFMQMLVDTGIIGFSIYAALLIISVYALIKLRGKEDLSPYLFGALLMIIFHGSSEFSMSREDFLPYAFAVFALISALHYSDTAFIKGRAKNFITPIIMLSMSIFIVLLFGNIVASSSVSAGGAHIDIIHENISIDVYDTNDYMLAYVMYSTSSSDPEVLEDAQKYLERLEKAKSNSVHSQLTTYYITQNNPEKAFERLISHIDYSPYNEIFWNNSIEIYLETILNSGNIENTYINREIYAEQFIMLKEKLAETNASSISEIRIHEVYLQVMDIIIDSEGMNETELLEAVHQLLYEYAS